MFQFSAAYNPIENLRSRLGVSTFEALLLYWMTSAVLFVTLVANTTHIETVDAVKMAPGLEMLVRLAGTGMGGLIGIYGFLCISRVRNAMFSFPGIWVTGITFFFVVGTAFSAYKGYAISHLVPVVCIVLFTPAAFVIVGSRRFIELTLLASLTTLVASWFLFIALPEYGTHLEVIDAETGEGVLRMGGTSHPNSLAGICGYTLMIVAFLAMEKRLKPSVTIPIVGLCLATYVFTQTRVAAVGAILAILFAYRAFWFRRETILFTFGLMFLGICGVSVLLMSRVGDIDSSIFTRSGDAEEITSFTGRDEIWAYIISEIQASPIVGHGPGVAKILLEKQSMLLHPHNVVLYLAFVGGVLCGVLGVFMFLNQLWAAFDERYKLAAMFTIYVFLNSLTETFIFDYIPGISTMMWLAAIYWPALDDGTLQS